MGRREDLVDRETPAGLRIHARREHGKSLEQLQEEAN